MCVRVGIRRGGHVTECDTVGELQAAIGSSVVMGSNYFTPESDYCLCGVDWAETMAPTGLREAPGEPFLELIYTDGAS